MTTTIKGSIHDILNVLPKTTRVEIKPYKIIVAWNGVLTLAFKAWPKQLMDIKHRINDLPEFRDTPENFGSKWPKSTLAALINDDVPPLTLDQLRNLTAICQEFDEELQQMDPITLTNCSVVLFSSRSLEHVLCRVDYTFKTSQDLQRAEQKYDEESYNTVNSVIEETQHLEEYIHRVNAPGHRWQTHYNSTHTESTLVCFLNAEDDEATCHLLDILESFRKRVDELLPNYHWMSQDSLHLSIRALENRSNLLRR